MSTLHDLTGSYVVDALSDIERRAFEQHLTECEACRQEVKELRATAALLASATPYAPAAHVRDLIMQRTSAQRQVVPSRRMPARSTTWLIAAAAALVMVLAGGGYWVGGLNRTNDRLAAQAALMNSVLSAPDVRAVSAAVVTGGRATVLSSRSRGTAVFFGTGLAHPGTTHTYELWWITADGRAMPAGTFDPASDGSAVASMPVGAGAGTVGLTVEPAGGSKSPTTKPIALVTLTS